MWKRISGGQCGGSNAFCTYCHRMLPFLYLLPLDASDESRWPRRKSLIFRQGDCHRMVPITAKRCFKSQIAMSSFNKITIVGYLGRDPVIRYPPQGAAVCNISVATTEWRKNVAG